VGSGDFFILGQPPLGYGVVVGKMFLDEHEKLILINEGGIEFVGVWCGHGEEEEILGEKRSAWRKEMEHASRGRRWQWSVLGFALCLLFIDCGVGGGLTVTQWFAENCGANLGIKSRRVKDWPHLELSQRGSIGNRKDFWPRKSVLELKKELKSGVMARLSPESILREI
jgi:hypothetical protein